MHYSRKFLAVIGLGVCAAGPIMADSHIMDLGVHEAGMTLSLDMVTADMNGMVKIFDYHLGEQGDMLGEAQVNAGANADVMVMLDSRPAGDVLAVLVDATGNAVAQSVVKLK